ncbi:hypothetical protein MLD38_039982 [Melastoma candidum]|uniref:Uncharacterized protein n=1 Tax=Melastoma candidum TaxID=119954 RepID=A0ACB9L3U8_9MYRT|nr:hypothetical protein MLD38_039982 [Melastoma candidum]
MPPRRQTRSSVTACLQEGFRHSMEEHTVRVKELTMEVLELFTKGLGLKERDALSAMVGKAEFTWGEYSNDLQDQFEKIEE